MEEEKNIARLREVERRSKDVYGTMKYVRTSMVRHHYTRLWEGNDERRILERCHSYKNI